MQFIRKVENKTIQTPTCGELTEVLVDRKYPLSITTAKGIKPTAMHYHKILFEIYWLLDGSITVVIENTLHIKKEYILHEGDTLVIEPNERHQIIAVSKTSKLVVLNSPTWIPGDEYTN